MIDNEYKLEEEILKNYFIVNRGFTGISESESRLYNFLSQRKHSGKIRNLDREAPGGMNTVFFNVMGYSPKTEKEVEPYSYYLATLRKNNLDMTNKEKNDLQAFATYYNYESVKDFIKELNPKEYKKYNYNDIWLTLSIFHLIENNQIRLKKYQNFILQLFNKNPNNTIIELIDNHEDKIIKFLKSLLPEIKINKEDLVYVTELNITYPKNYEVFWKDITLMLTLGFKYRGLYRPELQLGFKYHHLMTMTYMFYNTNSLIEDDIYRRLFKFETFEEYWGLEGNFPQLSYNSDFILFPILDEGKRTGLGEPSKAYTVWKDGFFLLTDELSLITIYPHLPRLELTDEYYSKIMGQEPGFKVPCIPNTDGVLMPLCEVLFNIYPMDDDFYNLTSFNMGVR